MRKTLNQIEKRLRKIEEAISSERKRE